MNTLNSTFGLDQPIATEMISTWTPPDVINENPSGILSGYVYFYALSQGNPIRIRREFCRELTKPLSPFRYLKPNINEGGKLHPREEWGDDFREGYHPLAIVKDAYRGPNHWHRCDDALICAVKKDGKWETRYFPKKNLNAGTWEEAQKILGVDLEQ